MIIANDTEYTSGGGLNSLYAAAPPPTTQQPLTTFGGTLPSLAGMLNTPPAYSGSTNVAAAPPPIPDYSANSPAGTPGTYSEQQKSAFLNSPTPPSFFSPMSPEESAIMAAWNAKNGSGGGSNGSTGGSNTTGVGSTSTSSGIPPRPVFFSPMGPEQLAAQQAWDAQYGTSPFSSGAPTSGPYQPPSGNTGGGTGYTPPGGGYGTPGSGYGNNGGGNTGAGNRPLYDYTYYRYGDGSQHLDEVNQSQGTMNEWNAMKNAWAKPTGP